jgi:TonB family protein
MATLARRLIIPFLLAASFAQTAFGQVVAGRDVVGPARDLYASARYDEALAVLNDLRPADTGTTMSDRKSIEQYRSLCLLALGRGTEAESAIAAVVTADPSYQPGEAEASPRVRSAFSDVRRRLLPDIASSRYAEAKALFDRKEYATAAQQLRHVVALLDDPDMGGKLPDLRTLVTGFLDLSVAASPPPPAPVKPAVSAPTPPAAPPVPQPDVNRVYTMLDTDVTPPVIVRQQMPRLAPSVKMQAKERGIVEIVIDEQGRVIRIAVRESVHPMFDAELMTMGREWRYQPAMLGGKPVRYRKLIQINITRQD